MIGRHFRDFRDLGAFFGSWVRLPGALPGDQPLRLRLELDEGAAVAGPPVEIVQPRR